MEEETKTVAEKMVEDLDQIARAMERIMKTGITKEMLVSIIYRETDVNITDIREVLNSLQRVCEELNVPYGG